MVSRQPVSHAVMTVARIRATLLLLGTWGIMFFGKFSTLKTLMFPKTDQEYLLLVLKILK